MFDGIVILCNARFSVGITALRRLLESTLSSPVHVETSHATFNRSQLSQVRMCNTTHIY